MENSTIIAAILGEISFLGVVFNWTVVIANKKIKKSKHSFVILTANQAFGDAIYSTIFLFYVCPMIYLDNDILLKYSLYAGYWLVVCYDLSTQSHFLISCNRFCAVFYPVKYSSIFSIKNTYIMALIVNIVSLLLTFGDYFIGCPLSWYSDLFLFNFPPTRFCSVIAFYANFCKYLLFIILVIVIDVTTVFRVNQLRKKIQNSTTSADKKAATQRVREMSFLKQTCVQGAIFTCELITYFILSPMIQDPWILFFCTSFAWVSVHSLDGFVTLMFNQDMKKFVKRILIKKGMDETGSRTGNTDVVSKISSSKI